MNTYSAGIALVLSVAACFGSCADAADKTITNKHNGFEITFPASWVATELPDGRAIGVSKASQRGDDWANDKSSVTVEVKKMTEGATLKDLLAERNTPEMRQHKGSTYKPEVYTKIAGVDACKITVLVDSPARTCVNYLLVSGGRSYVISTNAPTETYDQFSATLEAVIKSFKLIEAKK